MASTSERGRSPRTAASRRLASRIGVSLVFAAPSVAAAHDAFPTSTSIFAPPEGAGRVVLGTTFGLVASDDDGARWHLCCEDAISSFVSAYRLGPPPASVWYALSVDGLKLSYNGGCSWSVLAGGPTQDILPVDFSLDPTNDDRIVVAARTTTATTPYGIFELTRTVGVTPVRMYAAPEGRRLESVEVATADPRTIYATMTATGAPARGFLLRSRGGAETFDRIELTDFLAGRIPLLAGTGPRDARTVYLRLVGTVDEPGDGLAISRDAGETWSIPLVVEGTISGLLTRVDGTLLVVATYTTYVSSDGGTSFTPWDVGRTIRAVAERNGALFVAADNFVDGFAVGVTHDDGATWEPLIKYEDIQGPLECEPTGQRCQQTWAMLTDFLMRRMPTEPAPRDEPKGGGCACATPSGRAGWSLLLLLVAGWSRRSEHRR